MDLWVVVEGWGAIAVVVEEIEWGVGRGIES